MHKPTTYDPKSVVTPFGHVGIAEDAANPFAAMRLRKASKRSPALVLAEGMVTAAFSATMRLMT